VRAVPIKDSSGSIKEWIGALADVHVEKLAELELKRAKRDAESANQMKSSFLANMSHEIRTPMSAVLGFTEILKDTDLPPTERQDILERIERGGKTLLRLIDDILDNRILMKTFLESAGAQVDEAGDGRQAIQKVHENDSDVVLMDVQMPARDEIQATTFLRSEGYQKPILALTAHAMWEEIARSKKAGCNEHLTKPISRKILSDTVSRYMESQETI
jgi:CheY-like chemotaxis protein